MPTRSVVAESPGLFNAAERILRGKVNVHCRYPSRGGTSPKCVDVSNARFAAHNGAMSLSSVSVIANALRLRRVRLR